MASGALDTNDETVADIGRVPMHFIAEGKIKR